MTWPGIEPQSPGPLANTQNIMQKEYIKINKSCHTTYQNLNSRYEVQLEHMYRALSEYYIHNSNDLKD